MQAKRDGWESGRGDPRNVLVRLDEHINQETICARLFEEMAAPQAVVVSYAQSIEDWLSNHQRSALKSVAFVSVGETVRSTAAATPLAPPTVPDREPIIEGVADPADLTSLGLTVQSQLKEFHESGRGELVVCLDALPALVGAVSLRRAFRFLHLLTALIDRYDATAYYHATPELAPETLETLRPLFDAELDTQNSPDPSTWTLHPCRPRPTNS